MSERFGKIESDLAVGAGQSVRRNAGDTAFEEFTPAGTSDSQTLTNKTIDADDNTISNIETDNFKSGVIDTDETLSADSDTKIPTQQAVKGYVDDGVLTYIQTGWTPTGDTLTYASATTFTVSGDQTDRYSKGAKIKLTNSTVKYFYVVSSSYSSPNTTVTVTGESDLASGSITSPYFSYNDAPQGFYTSKVAVMSRTGQSIPNATFTNVSYDTSVYSSDYITNNTTNGRMDIKVSGFYLVNARLNYRDNPGGDARLNALSINGTQLDVILSTFFASDGYGRTSNESSATIWLDKGDYINQTTYQDAGGSLSCNAYLMVTFVHV